MANGKETVNLQAIADTAASQLGNHLTNVAGRHFLPSLVYVMMTSRLGLESDIFTAPFSVIQDQSKRVPGLAKASRLDDIGNLRPNVSVAEHIELVSSHNPGVAFILDQETAIYLSKDKKRKVTMIDYGDDHCLLTGLNSRGIDVYLTCSMKVIKQAGGIKIVEYKP